MQKEDYAKALDLYNRALKLVNWLPWERNVAMCLTYLSRWDEAYTQWEHVINDSRTPDADISFMRDQEWSLMYYKGYICPHPPRFNGIEGCYRRPDHKTLNTTYVPLPMIEGKSWTAKKVLASGDFTVITPDGHTWYSNQTNMTTINLLNSRIKTGEHTAVRFVLPDDTELVLGPQSDITIDKFIYNPNESYTEMTIDLIKGFFRFVTGKLSHQDPASKNVK